MSKKPRRSLSSGTIFTIILTIIILGMYAVIIPSMTGHSSITADFAKLAVAVDSSIVRIASTVQTQTSTEKAFGSVFASQTSPKINNTVVPATPEPTATPTPKIRFTLSAAGSISINTEVLKAMKVQGEYQLNWLFDTLSNSMKADLSIVTLNHTIISDSKVSNRNMPSELLTSIAQLGVNTICNGYDDILCAGISGITATKSAITNAGLISFGICSTEDERKNLPIISVNGVKIALLHYQDVLSSAGKKNTTQQERDFAIAPLNIKTIQNEIESVKAAGAQVILISLCWGEKKATQPTEEQKQLAQSIADAGADFIIGTYPNAVETVEILSANREDGKYHPVLCAYSLGNLLTADREKRVSLAGMILNATVEYNPTEETISFLSYNYQPTYSWRGKYEGGTRYRVLSNDGASFPEFVDVKQQKVMSACYQIIHDLMKDTVIPSVYQ